MLKTVIRTQTDMVMVFNENGLQISEYQGRYEDVKESILLNASRDTVFKHWHENAEEPENVPFNYW